MSNTPLPSDPSGAAQARLPSAKSLADAPMEELEHLASEFGLDPSDYRTKPRLLLALDERKSLIASLNRDAMIELVKWSGAPVSAAATREQLAHQISRITTMRFVGLSKDALVTLALMRGVRVRDNDDVERLSRRLKKSEGFFTRINRRRRAWIGSIVSGMLGETAAKDDVQFQAPQEPGEAPVSAPPPVVGASIKDEIEDSGLFGGIANRVKKTADVYLNQKLDEIEARIDRKLDEIDRRLADWRDKEVANRIRIIKITLWISVIVALISLVYLYVGIYLPWLLPDWSR